MLSYTHNERDHKCCQGALRVVVPGSVSDTEGGPVGDEVDEILDNDTAEGTTDQDIASLEINYMMGDFLLTSISAYTEDDIFGAFRSDLYTRTALPLNDSWEDYEQFTQELRLTSSTEGALSYVAGLYYYDQDIDRSFERVIDLYGIGLAPAATQPGYHRHDPAVTGRPLQRRRNQHRPDGGIHRGHPAGGAPRQYQGQNG
jgi:hypothetical protein